MPLPPLDPHPISDSLDRHLNDALSKIETGKRGQATVAVSTVGAEVAVGMRLKKNVTVSGYTGREWGGRGWLAGARAGIAW